MRGRYEERKGKVTGKDNYIWTVNPNSKIEFCKDGVGGGKYKVLPPKLEGTYTELMKAWGVEDG
jgi:hypothetical protein